MKKYLEKIKTLRKESAYKQYEYEYFNKTPNGMVRNDNINNIFGKTRKGYDKFKSENPDSYIDISNTYIRSVYDKVSNKINGYILEKQVSNNDKILEVKKLFTEAFNHFCKLLDVKDRNALLIYIEKSSALDFNTITNELEKIHLMIEILNDYNFDPDFKMFLDKIIS